MALDVVFPKQFIKRELPEKSIEKLNRFVYDFIQDKILLLKRSPRMTSGMEFVVDLLTN